MSSVLNYWGDVLPSLLRGLRTSVELTGASLGVGLPLGLVLAVLGSSRGRAARLVSLVVVEIGRGIPALVVLELVYFGLPQVSLTLTSFTAATAGLGFVTAAYTSEILRAGLQAVPQGQHEAAQAIGLSRFDQLRYVIVPQGVRIALPPLLGFSILVFQGTSLAFAIALPELLSKSYAAGSESFRYMEAIGLAALLYAAVAMPAASLVHMLERRMGRHT
jgi:polar amino acid transport system permease protein